MRRSERIKIQDLARLLALTADGLRRELARRGVEPRRSSAGERYWLPDVVACLSSSELARLREAERRERMQVRTSRNWIAGHPELVAQWHLTKNVDLFPDEVRAGSTRMVWWQCPAGPDHVWRSQARRRASFGQGCPFCAGRRVSVTNSLASRSPEIAAQWDESKNGKLTPRDVTFGSRRKVAWQCPVASDHRWRTEVGLRTRGTGCPFCAGQSVSATNCLSTIAPAIAKQWYRTRNGGRSAARVVAGSPERAWWRCTVDRSHVWRASIKSRVENELGCPFCSGKRATPATSLQSENPSLAAEWDTARNRPLTPQEVRPVSRKRVWWICPKDRRHRFQQSIADRAYGVGCPMCAGRVVDATNSLAAARPDLVAEWHPKRNGSLTPRDVTRGSGRRVWWRCRNNLRHVWEASVMNRACGGTGCPTCARTTASPRRASNG